MKINLNKFKFEELERAVLEMLKNNNPIYRLGYQRAACLFTDYLEGYYSIGMQDDLFTEKEVSFVVEEAIEELSFEVDQIASPEKFWEGAMEASKNFLLLAEMVYGEEERNLAS